ncbi:MAG: succinate--CoA ligase subunit alpha [Armatimonadetes bacterium]|nr:succinate--CoA ligase subunit alpha [Armatimonadota bacterium]
MSVLVDAQTRLLVQGITGREGSFHTEQMIAYGTKVVGGVTPGKGGSQHLGVPVFDSVRAAVAETGANATVIFVPAAFAGGAIIEAADAELPLIVCITEGIPTADMIKACAYVRAKGVRLVGANCPGLLSAGQCKVGIIPGHIAKPGNVGVVSRSGTLTYEAVDALTRAGLGLSTIVGIGGDPVLGPSFIDVLPLFERDDETAAIVMIGEIGGNDEEVAAELIKTMQKPVVGFIGGRSAPEGKRMGHAGAIVSGGSGTAEGKVSALQAAGVPVPETVQAIPELVQAALRPRLPHKH